MGAGGGRLSSKELVDFWKVPFVSHVPMGHGHEAGWEGALHRLLRAGRSPAGCFGSPHGRWAPEEPTRERNWVAGDFPREGDP